MTTDEYLSQIRKLNKVIEDSLEDLDDMRRLAESVSSKRPVADLVISSGKKDRLETIIVKILDKEVDIERVIESYIEKREAIIKQLQELDLMEYNVLRMRFINGLRFGRVLELLNESEKCSERQMYRIYDSGMKNFKAKFGETYKNL